MNRETMQAEHDASRKRYINGEISHAEHYTWLADRIGVTIEDITIKAPQLLASEDDSFNDIPLRRWDDQHGMIRSCATQAGMRSWSLSDSVCVAKAVARRWVDTRKQLETNQE